MLLYFRGIYLLIEFCPFVLIAVRDILIFGLSLILSRLGKIIVSEHFSSSWWVLLAGKSMFCLVLIWIFGNHFLWPQKLLFFPWALEQVNDLVFVLLFFIEWNFLASKFWCDFSFTIRVGLFLQPQKLSLFSNWTFIKIDLMLRSNAIKFSSASQLFRKPLIMIGLFDLNFLEFVLNKFFSTSLNSNVCRVSWLQEDYWVFLW